jgi:predicted metal-binding membrane protein
VPLGREDSEAMIGHPTPLEVVLRRDRLIVLAGLTGVAALAWVYILHLARTMSGMDMGSMHMGMDMAMPKMVSWSTMDIILTFVMWAVMMVAMMVPSAAPMILVFATVSRQRREQRRPFIPASVFLLGYVAIWCGFAAAATGAQWGLHSTALLSPMLVSTSPFLGGALLLVAGLFQWSPLKSMCLTRCRTPLGFLMSEWREGPKGVFVMGVRHGIFCLGCCWALMALLLVLGVMNLLWIAALAGFVLIEKVAPAGQWVSRVTGVLLVGWGTWMMLSSWG